MTNKRKQSFIAGALTSSAGIFISKALGLLYIVPFTAMAGEANMVFYSKTYTYYDLLLQVCSAGIPFAVAALVAKYANREDYKTVVLIRKLSTSILLTSGFIMAVLFSLLSKPLSSLILGPNSTPSDIQTQSNLFMILSIAIFLVPFLSRVYTAIVSISIAALATIVYFLNFDKKNYYVINRAARMQKTPAKEKKEIIIEIISYGIPFLISSVLGSSMDFVNTNFFQSAMATAGYPYEEAKLLEGIIQVQCNKLTSIPQVLALGFSSGIVPYLTISLEKHDWKGLQKNVLDCLDTVLYIALPMCFCLLVLARPIYYLMYGSTNLDYGQEALAWSSLLAITGTISPICTSMMMTLRQRKRNISYLLIGFIVKCITFYPMIQAFGYIGAITSSVLTSCVIIFLNLQCISNRFRVNYQRVVIRALKMIVCLFACNGAFFLLNYCGLSFTYDSKLMTFGLLAIYGIVCLLVYIYTTSLLKLPQKIFNFTSFKALFRKVFKS